MHLIQALASGVNGAAYGSVGLYRRGTSTRVTYYTSFEGGGATLPTADVALDANGGGIFYVNELADCIVKSSTGVIVREFVAGANATAVEVMSDSFTGPSYSTGQIAVNNPTTLKAILDKWNDSAGTLGTDFKVSIGGAAAINLSTAFGNFSGMFFNVKSAAYGAVGDGVADDTSAIQAAIIAAQAAGGGIVFFPTGTYRTTTALSVTGASIAFMGSGANASQLLIDHASNGLISFTGSAALATFQGLTLGPKQASSGTMLNVTVGMSIRFDSCLIGNAFLTTGIGLSCNTASGAVAVCVGCIFQVGGSAQFIVTSQGMAACYACRFVFPATAYGVTAWSSSKGALAIGCWFEASLVTSGTFTGIAVGATATVRSNIIMGCQFQAPAGGTFTAWTDTAGSLLQEGLNSYGTGVLTVGVADAGSASNTYGSTYLSRQSRKGYVSSTGGGIINVDGAFYGSITIVRTVSNADNTVNIDNLTGADQVPPGSLLSIIYYNNSGGNIVNLTFSGAHGSAPNDCINCPVFTLNNAKYASMLFVLMESPFSAQTAWVCVSRIISP
jgi:hypothetical protein